MSDIIIAAAEAAETEIARLEKLNADLTKAFNTLLVDNSRWEDKANKARDAALEEAAKLIEEGFHREIDKKINLCEHGIYIHDDCDRCSAAAIRALKS
jgi:hypothetical protein